MKLVVLYRQPINLSRLARPESVTAVWTFSFHRRHGKEIGSATQRDASVSRRMKLAILLLGALVVSVGSSEVSAAKSRTRRSGHSGYTVHRAAWHAAPRHSRRAHARHGRTAV